MRGPSAKWSISKQYAGALARLILACVMLAGCNVFSMVGILDGHSTSSSGGSSTLKLLPDAANVVVGTTKQFTATGGSGGYTYSVEAGGAGGTVNASGLYTAPGTTGTDSVTVTDSAGSAYSATAMVVPPGNDPLSISPASATVGAGGSIVFTASGGSGVGYTYSVFSGGGSIVGATGAYTAPWSADNPVIRVTDSLLNTADAAVTVTAPTALQITPLTATLEAHGSVTFSASGGSGSYTFSIFSGGGSIVGATGAYTAPWSADSPVIRVTDNNTASTADTTAVTVNPPAALHISPKTTSIYDNGSVTFTASGGSGTHSYLWISGPGGPGSVVGSTYTPGSAGPPPGVIRVTDTFTLQTDDATVTVDTVPVGLAISPKVITIDAGSILNFTATGGTPPYNYAKLDGGGNLVGATYTAPWSATTAHIRVTDAVPNTDTATVTVNALPPLVINPSTTSLNVGQNVIFTGSGGSGNSGNYSYTKISGGGTLVGATYTAPGSATTAVIQLRDTLTLQTSNATVTVNAPPPLTITPASSNVVVGNAVTFTPGGGSGSYSYSLVQGTGTLVGATYTTVAAETSVVRLRDTITLNTQDATVISYFTLAIIPSSASVQVNDTYPFSASGGIPPYTYSVIAGTGTINASTGLFTAPAGAQSDTVKVIDSIANSCIASVTVEPPGPWNIVSIDASARSGQYASLALDSSGLPRIAYYESQAKELRLATWNGSSWSVQTVDNSTSNIGQYCSLALAPGTGYPRISYYDAHNHDLKYASWNGSSWVRQTVASSNDVGKYTSLALEPGTGYPRISYYDETNDNLKYAAWNGSSWSTQTVDSPGSVGLNTSLVLEPGTNRPRISYYNTSSDDLKCAYWNGSSWVLKSVDTSGNVGNYSSLALEPGTNNPRISYYDATNKDLKYAWSNDGGSTWTKQTVDSAGDVGMYTSLALEPGTNHPRISYFDNTNKDLKYAWYNGTIWTIETVDSTSQVGSYSSLKLDPVSFKPRIAYYDSSSQDLKYAAKP